MGLWAVILRLANGCYSGHIRIGLAGFGSRCIFALMDESLGFLYIWYIMPAIYLQSCGELAFQDGRLRLIELIETPGL
jgi:hypothetical protein